MAKFEYSTFDILCEKTRSVGRVFYFLKAHDTEVTTYIEIKIIHISPCRNINDDYFYLLISHEIRTIDTIVMSPYRS